ncbi:hypothetical protein [Burkholderia sp. JP2-270]|uniref:pirin family protein n=1 Tax=Burkholderia sp. JP2-270 TaxID=2217913 RepID=UPI001EF78784|nr:hypothetical protein [Burkholderia sp. JP2-270]
MFQIRRAADRDQRSHGWHESHHSFPDAVGRGGAPAFDVPAGRRVYAHVARGEVEINGRALAAGDGAGIGGVDVVTFARGRAAEV